MTARPEAIAVVLLAAGAGTRMRSARSKVLHEICGLPMLHYPLAAAEALEPARTLVVVGRDGEEVQERFAQRADFVLQAEQRGTGHAVLQARDALRDFSGAVLILYADTPVLRPESLRALREAKDRTGAPLAMLTADWPLPGRVVRGADGGVERIVEVTDATPEELSIVEGNTGVYLVEAELLWKMLGRLDDGNQQGELYLTDIVAHAVAEGHRVEAVHLEDPEEAMGVNTRQELAQAAAALRRRTAERLMAEGVTLVDPASTYLDANVEVGRDTVIQPGCVVTGDTRIGERVLLKAYSVIESSQVEDDAVVGPMAHLRPGTHLGSGARVGNFVEVKNSRLGAGVKADHLSYIGDADVGAGTSFGCGSITVNYDGVAKHRTRVGERVFVGCNANLIAPVQLEDDAFVAAGSTVTRDVPAGALAVERDRQRNVEGWRERRDKRKQEGQE